MPPQEDEQPMAVVVSEEKEETQAGEKAAGSYWDEPPEEKLQGKTLSTLSLTGLGRVEHDDSEAKEDDGSKQNKKDDDHDDVIRAENPAKGGYWDFQEVIRKSLSKLSLSDLAHGASFTPNNSTPNNSTPNTTDGNPNNSPSSGTVDNGVDADNSEGIKRKPSTNSFWFWPNRSANNLQDIPKDTKTTTEKTISRSTSATGGYWFWRNASANNLTEGNSSSDSNVSLETLEKKARESDRIEGRKGPISNLQHRMRNTWRASFQRLSTNTLSKLDESSPAAKEKEESNAVSKGWKEDFEKGMKRNDSFLVQEEGEESMTF